ncbi:MAG: flagellar protein FlaG [Planctomycetota bacterium]|jgi:uncharacterized FlaG/YvyC family protein
MDISNVKPLDDSRGPKDAPQRPTGEHEREVGQNTAADAQPPSQAPEAGGVVASSHAQGGSIRDAADQQQTKDHAAAASRLAEFVEAMRQETGFEGTVRLAIDVDENTSATSFLLMDKDSGAVLRTVPDTEFVPLLRDLADRSGLMLDREL